MRILLVGDSHGNSRWLRRVIEKAVQLECDTVLQLGDFGFWEHSPIGRRFLDDADREASAAGLVVHWIDGNHENHSLLRKRYMHETYATPEGFYAVRPNVHYIPRGCRWTWGGVSFLGLGGAYSVDIAPDWARRWPGRVKGHSWWPEETITDDEVVRAVSGGPVDVMVTHDAPTGVDIPAIRNSPRHYPVADENRKRVLEVVKSVSPLLLVHGHYHCRYTDSLDLPSEANGQLEWHRVYVEGFACDNDKGVVDGKSTAVLDTEAFVKAKKTPHTEGTPLHAESTPPH